MVRRLLIAILFLIPIIAVGVFLSIRQTPSIPEVKIESGQYLLDHARSVLAALRKGEIDQAKKIAPPSPQPADLKSYCGRPAFIELYGAARFGRLQFSGEGGCPAENLTKALTEAYENKKLVASSLKNLNRSRIKIDLLGPFEAFPSKKLKKLQRHYFEPGLDGVRMVAGGESEIVLPADPLTEDLAKRRRKTIDNVIKKLSRRLKLSKDDWKSPAVALERFRTESFVEASPDGEALRLYRGMPLDSPTYTTETLESGVRLWGDWLINHIDEDGKFLYEYYPVRDRASRSYNIVRHAGTCYGLLQLYQHTGEKKYLEGAKKALAFVDRHLHRPSDYSELADHPRLADQENIVFYVEDPRMRKHDKANLGSAALALMAYVHLPPSERSPDQQKIVEGLANFMRFLLIKADDRDGRFYTTFGQALDQQVPKKQARYYPGEAFLAWMYLYQEAPDPRWLDAAERVARYQIDEFAATLKRAEGAIKKKRIPIPDAWVVQALSFLWEATKNDFYGDACYDMAEEVLKTQYTPDNAGFPDYIGGFNNAHPPRSTPAGSRSEGMSQAYRLAAVQGNDALADKFGTAIVRSARFMLHHQYNEANSYFVKNPERALGGNRGSLVNTEVRIDYNQHAMSAVMVTIDAAKRFEARGVNLADLMTGDLP